MAKTTKKAKKAKKAKTAKRPAGKRDLVKGKNATMFAKRSAKGRFKEIDETGKSLRSDRRSKAKTKAKSGFGDRGDR